MSRWPGAEIWVTEYAYAHQDLSATQEVFRQTLEYFDREDYIGRYSYFGAIRSWALNVGPNAAFLNNDGELTDIGAWYLGFDATAVDPQSGDETGDASRPSAKGCVLALAAGFSGAALVGLL